MFRMEGLYHIFELIKTTNFEYFYITSLDRYHEKPVL